MSRPKVHPLVVASLLAAGALVPRAAHARRASAAEAQGVGPARAFVAAVETDATAATAVTPAAAEPPAPATQDAAAKPKGNAFVRALTAPFRALARLFGGGGRKAASGAARRSVEKPAEAKRVEPQPAARVAENSGESKPSEAPASSAVADATRPAAPPSVRQGVNIVRPDEQALAPPSGWVPFVEGVRREPLAQGRALLERGHLQEAVAELSIAAATGDDLVEANNLLGLAYDRLGWHRQAAEAYERGLTVDPQNPILLTNLGYSLYLANDFGDALARLRQAARLAPAFALVHNHLGLVQARLGKYDDAFKSFARAHGEYEAHLRLAGLLEFVNRERQAVKHYEAALRLQPGTTAVLERLVALYERTGDRTKADTARRTLGKPRNEQRTTTGGG